jgi:acetyltransferase-like isoleucine patch superfamily enzyme
MTVRSLGRHSYMGDGFITTPVTVGNFTSIAPGVRMVHRIQHPCVANPNLVSTAAAGNLPGYPNVDMQHGIDIGHDVWIGENAVLLAPLVIGNGAIIGAHAVVAKSVPHYAVVVGNPCQIKRFRFDEDTIDQLLEIQWWSWPDDVIAERLADLHDVTTLVAKYGYETFRTNYG